MSEKTDAYRLTENHEIWINMELANREYWTRKKWFENFGKMLEENKKLQEKLKPLFKDMRDLLKKSEDPTWVHRLSFYLKLYNLSEDNAAERDPNNSISSVRQDRKILKNRPPFYRTTNEMYGRFGYMPHESGGQYHKRYAYSKHRKIGGFTEFTDKFNAEKDDK